MLELGYSAIDSAKNRVLVYCKNNYTYNIDIPRKETLRMLVHRIKSLAMTLSAIATSILIINIGAAHSHICASSGVQSRVEPAVQVPNHTVLGQGRVTHAKT